MCAVVLPRLGRTGRTTLTGSQREPARPATVQFAGRSVIDWVASASRDAAMSPIAKWSDMTEEQPP
jgi:hypothetical protein